MQEWYVYVIYSASLGVYYVGCTNCMDRRLLQHNGLRSGGAKYTAKGRPWVLKVMYGPYDGRGSAQSAEYKVKKLRGAKRLSWGGNG